MGARWGLLFGVTLALLGALRAGAAQRPNIILITVDTFRADRIGYYGYKRDTSPALDRFSREGVFFKQAFTTSGWTTPGLISLLTSLYAPTHGVDIRARRLDPEVPTLVDILKESGYRVPDIFFLTDLPNFSNLGFESYSRRKRYLQKGDEILFRWLEEEASDQTGKPFFLYYHYRELHQPYNPEPPYDQMFMPPEYGPNFSISGVFKKFLSRERMQIVRENVMLPRGVADFGTGDRAWLDALYDGQVRRLDDQLFARLRQVLEAQGLANNTMVIVSADHGEELLDHGLIGHVSTFQEGRLYDEVLRIPLVFWCPDSLPSSRVVEEPLQCIDALPTILELLELEGPQTLQGQSLLPLIEERPGWVERPIFAETSGGGYTADEDQYAQRFRVVRTERWKLSYSSAEAAYRLYDLVQDSLELEDVSDRYTSVADSLRTLLSEWVLYAQRRPYRQAAEEREEKSATNEVAGPVDIIFPADGDTLYYQGADYSIRPQWSGTADATYIIEYEIGPRDPDRAAYHLEGVIKEEGTSPNYGPFQASFWDALVLYNPWRFRIYREDAPQHKSEWITFYLAPSQGGQRGFSFTAAAVQLHLGLLAGLRDGRNLFVGLGLGLVDLFKWVATWPAADLSAWALLVVLGGALVWPRVQRLGVDRARLWGIAVLYIAFVYATVPIMRQVWRLLNDYTEGAVASLGIVLVVGVGGIVLWRVVQQRRKFSGLALLALVCIAIAYAYLLMVFARFPAERLHLVEYGLVGFFLYRALRLDLEPGKAYLSSFALTVVVGFIDECIQWVLPQRYFEMKDVQLNAISGALGLLVVYFTTGARRDD